VLFVPLFSPNFDFIMISSLHTFDVSVPVRISSVSSL
jgi:hypothetical protein